MLFYYYYYLLACTSAGVVCPTWGSRWDQTRISSQVTDEAFVHPKPRAVRPPSTARQKKQKNFDIDIILGPFLTDLSALRHPTRDARPTQLSAHAYWMLIGACNLML